ncbi:MAG: hypothetical protein HOI22_13875 [Tateyamaria sp.]|nr:hypothetical protein [Tateyamaria sp.]
MPPNDPARCPKRKQCEQLNRSNDSIGRCRECRAECTRCQFGQNLPATF